MTAEIVERTDGIPLFVEGDDEGGAGSNRRAKVQEGGETVTRRFHTQLAVPPSLHASLMARLDRLGPAKELAQIGATIGREFSHAVVSCGGS